jgi:hypothetical protein
VDAKGDVIDASARTHNSEPGTHCQPGDPFIGADWRIHHQQFERGGTREGLCVRYPLDQDRRIEPGGGAALPPIPARVLEIVQVGDHHILGVRCFHSESACKR